MKCIHVLRKPCSEPTVAANVLRHGTGALDIDATRIGSVEDVSAVHATRKSDYPQSYKGDGAGWGRTRGGYAGDEVHWEPKGGRWPANLILQHLDGCVQEGTRRVKGHSGNPNGPKGSTMHYASSAKSVSVRPNAWVGHADKDGKEIIPDWLCAHGCPIAALDEQSGDLHSRGNKKSLGAGRTRGVTGWGHGREGPPRPELNDSGGASRFFKQVGGRVPPSGGDHGGSD